MDLPDLIVLHRNGFAFGVGFDAGSSSLRRSAVVGEPTGTPHAGGPEAQRFDVSKITSSQDLAKKLSINVEASAGAGCFGASVAARFSYMEESKVQSSSLFMTITSSIILEDLSIESPALNADAASLVDNYDVFHERYGDMFARGCSRGGLFVGVLQVDTKDSKQSEDISAQLKGSYGFFSADASTTFSSVAKSGGVEIYCSMHTEGGPAFDTTHPESPDVMLQYANEWFKAMHEDPDHNAVPLSWSMAPMAIAAGPTPANAAEITHAQDVIVFCARERLMILDQLNLTDHIVQNPSIYDYVAPTTPADVVTAFKGYQADLDVVASAASQTMNDITKAVLPEEYATQTGKTYPKGVPPSPMPTMAKGLEDALAVEGRTYAAADPLLTALRDSVPEGVERLGFDVGVAIMHANTLWGPGAEQHMKSLDETGQLGFRMASDFCLARNNNATLALKGASIAKADPAVLAARNEQPVGNDQLGFDIASALYGDPKLGSIGSTLMGPGSDTVRASLMGGQAGFNASFAFHTARHYTR